VNIFLLLEAALRSLVMGAVVFALLRVLRIDQVRARRTAWLLALAGALAMPALVGAHIGPRLLPELAPNGLPAARIPSAAYLPVLSATSIHDGATLQRASRVDRWREVLAGLTGTVGSLAVLGYCAVAAVLTMRLCAGFGLALRLRNQAQRVIVAFDPDLDVRVSSRILTPVTIGSSVLLPCEYTSWDVATLRIVLSHERAHVRQSDFYVHALAGLHCALFWFTPLSWWLQRQLAELGEALSDCAAVEQAESRASYAEILLAFATRGRALAGVAMASASNLAPRIERLLSERDFARAFAAKQRLPYMAAGVVVISMAAATAMVRVQAAPASDDPHEDGVLAIHIDHAHTMFGSGDSLPSQRGDYIYFQHDGKPYLIRDPAIIAQAQAMLEPMKALREQQRELGLQQRELARQQATLGTQSDALASAQLHAAKIDTPEFKRDMAELKNVVSDLHVDELTAQVDRNVLAEVQMHLAEIQAATGKLRADLAIDDKDFAARLGELGESQGQLGEQQGKLGEQQARLGDEQRKIGEEIRRALRPLIEQTIREGKGTVVTEP
jgi:hypothetical protein